MLTNTMQFSLGLVQVKVSYYCVSFRFPAQDWLRTFMKSCCLLRQIINWGNLTLQND